MGHSSVPPGGTLKCPTWHIWDTNVSLIGLHQYVRISTWPPIGSTQRNERKVVEWDTWVSHLVGHSSVPSGQMSILTSSTSWCTFLRHQKSSIVTSPPPIFAPASWEVTDSASVRFAFRALLVLIDERKSGSSFPSSTSSSFLLACLLYLDFFFFYFGEAEKSESEPFSTASLSTASCNCDCSSFWFSSIASSISDSTKPRSESEESTSSS